MSKLRQKRTPQEKFKIVLEGLRGDYGSIAASLFRPHERGGNYLRGDYGSIAALCNAYGITQTDFYGWRDILMELLFAAAHHSSAFFQPLSGDHSISLSCSTLRHGPRKAAMLITISSNSRGASVKWFFRQKACLWTCNAFCVKHDTVRILHSRDAGENLPQIFVARVAKAKEV